MGSKYNKDFINNSIFKYNTCIFLACFVDKDIVFPKNVFMSKRPACHNILCRLLIRLPRDPRYLRGTSSKLGEFLCFRSFYSRANEDRGEAVIALWSQEQP